MVDSAPADHLRFEVAFATGPDDPAPAWVDVTSRVHLPSGITIRRGREDEFGTVSTGTMTLSLENIDGALTPELASSPFYPNVLPQRRARLTYRDPVTLGTQNLIPAGDAGFEGGTTNWRLDTLGSISLDTAHADTGTQSMLVSWSTDTSGQVSLVVGGLTIGRAYTARARVWVTAGTPDVRLAIVGGATGASTATKGAFATVTLAFTATAATHQLAVKTVSAPTTGQQTWVDSVMLDETPAGVSLGAFTTTPPAVVPIFDGQVDEWPVEWPDAGETYSRAQVTATDLLVRLGSRQKLRSVVVETIALDSPLLHFPLNEGSGATSVASIAGSAAVLNVTQIGSGGALDFASGTGVPTDGGSAPKFTPASLTNGLYLTGYVGTVNTESGRWSGSGVTLQAAIASTGTSGAEAVTLSDRKGNELSIGYDSTGRAFAAFSPWNSDRIGTSSVVGSTVLNNGTTHRLAATITPNGSSAFILALYVDGVSVGSVNMFMSAIGSLNTLTIGGAPGTSAFTGTISHVTAWGSPLLPSQIAEHNLAMSTGFAGERSDQRIARVCTWIGLPAARQNLEVGLSTISHIDSTGKNPLEYMRVVEATEAGLLFAGTDGRLTLHNRTHVYASTAPAATFPASMLNGDARLVKNLALVKNRINASRLSGATMTALDSSSIAAYDYLDDDFQIAANSDADLAAAVSWRLFVTSTPRVRFTNLALDGLTDPTYSPAIRAGIDLNARVQATGLPAQAPASTSSQQIQGYTLTISDSSWDYAVNASPYAHLIALVLDDPTYGALDSYPLAY